MDKSQIRERMKVVGSDGRSIGSVDRVEGERIKLSKSDFGDGSTTSLIWPTLRTLEAMRFA
jgi:hypothetical protein